MCSLSMVIQTVCAVQTANFPRHGNAGNAMEFSDSLSIRYLRKIIPVLSCPAVFLFCLFMYNICINIQNNGGGYETRRKAEGPRNRVQGDPQGGEVLLPGRDSRRAREERLPGEPVQGLKDAREVRRREDAQPEERDGLLPAAGPALARDHLADQVLHHRH